MKYQVIFSLKKVFMNVVCCSLEVRVVSVHPQGRQLFYFFFSLASFQLVSTLKSTCKNRKQNPLLLPLCVDPCLKGYIL